MFVYRAYVQFYRKIWALDEFLNMLKILRYQKEIKNSSKNFISLILGEVFLSARIIQSSLL